MKKALLTIVGLVFTLSLLILLSIVNIRRVAMNPSFYKDELVKHDIESTIGNEALSYLGKEFSSFTKGAVSPDEIKTEGMRFLKKHTILKSNFEMIIDKSFNWLEAGGEYPRIEFKWAGFQEDVSQFIKERAQRETIGSKERERIDTLADIIKNIPEELPFFPIREYHAELERAKNLLSQASSLIRLTAIIALLSLAAFFVINYNSLKDGLQWSGLWLILTACLILLVSLISYLAAPSLISSHLPPRIASSPLGEKVLLIGKDMVKKVITGESLQSLLILIIGIVASFASSRMGKSVEDKKS